MNGGEAPVVIKHAERKLIWEGSLKKAEQALAKASRKPKKDLAQPSPVYLNSRDKKMIDEVGPVFGKKGVSPVLKASLRFVHALKAAPARLEPRMTLDDLEDCGQHHDCQEAH